MFVFLQLAMYVSPMVLLLTASQGGATPVLPQSGQRPVESTYIDSFASSRGFLQKYSVNYRYEITSSPSSGPPVHRNEVIEGSISRDDTRFRRTSEDYIGEGDAGEPLSHRQSVRLIWTGDRLWQLGTRSGESLAAFTQSQYDLEVLRARLCGAELLHAVYPYDKVPVYEIMKQGKTTVREEPERVGGAECIVIESEGPHGKYTIWVDPERENVILRAHIVKRPDSLAEDTPIKDLEWMPLDELDMTLEDVAVEQIDGHYVATGGTMVVKRRLRDGKGNADFIQKSSLENMNLHPDFEAEKPFSIEMPNGTPVVDADASGIKFVWQDGRVVPHLDDEEIAALEEQVDELTRAVAAPKSPDVAAAGLPVTPAEASQEPAGATPRALVFLLLVVMVVLLLSVVAWRATRRRPA
jgi:hypothetical protein